MGLFDFLFTDEEEQKTETEQTRTEDRTANTLTTGVQNEDLFSRTKLLDSGVQTSIEDLVLKLSGDGAGSGEDISNIATILLGRATGAADSITEDNQALIDRARFEGTRELQTLTAGLSRGAGGGVASNSFVAGATGEASAALEIGLAGLSSELNIGARNTETQELTNAADVFATGAAAGAADNSALAQLLSVLKGAEAETTQTGEKRSLEETTAIENLTALLTGEQTQTGSSTEGLFGQLFPKGLVG